MWFGDEYSIILPAFVAYELVTRNALESPKKEFLKEASSLMLPELTLAKFKGLGSIFRYRKTTKPLAYVEKGVSKTTNIIGKTDETTTYINNLFKGARERAIAKFGKEAEELIYFKFNKDGGAAAEIIDHYGAEGLKALKKANKIDDVAKELVKDRTVYRAVNEQTYNFDKLKKEGIIDASPKEFPTYVSLDTYSDAVTIQQKLQLPKQPTWVAEFDGNQIIKDVRIPEGKYMKASYKEVLCKSFPEINGLKLEGGGAQFITNSAIKIRKLTNLKTGEVIRFNNH